MLYSDDSFHLFSRALDNVICREVLNLEGSLKWDFNRLSRTCGPFHSVEISGGGDLGTSTNFLGLLICRNIRREMSACFRQMRDVKITVADVVVICIVSSISCCKVEVWTRVNHQCQLLCRGSSR